MIKSSIRARLTFLCAVLLCLLVASTAYLTREISDLLEIETQQVELIAAVKTANVTHRAFGDLKYWLSDHAVSLLMRSEIAARAAHVTLDSELSNLEKYDPNIVSLVRTELDEVVKLSFQAIDAYADDQRVLGNSLMARARVHISRVDQELGGLVHQVDARAAEMQKTIEAESNRVAVVSFFIVILGGAIGLAITVYIVRSINHPLHALVEAISAITQGDLNAGIPEPSDDEFGEMTRALSLLRDSLIERKRFDNERARSEAKLRESEERFEKAFNRSPSMLAIISERSGEIIDVNDPWLTALGGDRTHVIGRPADDAKMWVDADTSRAFAEALIRRQSIDRFDARWLTAGDRIGEFELSAETIELNGEPCAIVAAIDVTERNRVDRLKDEFVSMVSHELRTPLTSIKGSLDLLTAGVTGHHSDDTRRLIEIAKNNSDRLLLIVNDILDSQKIQSGTMDYRLQPLDLLPALKSSLAVNQALGNSKNTPFKLVDGLPGVKVNADPQRFQQILANLLSNAVKFSPNGNAVEVFASRKNGMIRTTVQDYGPGIPPEFHDRVFDKFSQADGSNSRAASGTGLGLNIAKMIVEGMGGDIGFVSRSGEGCAFYFDLPEVED